MDIKKDELLEFFSEINNKAEAYFNSKVKPAWETGKRIYDDRYTFSDYKPEQENVRLPVGENLVRRLASVFKTALVNLDNDYFTVENVPPDKAFVASGSQSLAGYVLSDNEFPKQFDTQLQLGFITSLVVFKVAFEEESITFRELEAEGDKFTETEELVGKVKIIPILPNLIRLDPTLGSDNYIIEIAELPLHEFREYARINNWDTEEVEKVIDTTIADSPEIDPNTGTINPEAFNPIVELRTVHAKVAYNAVGKEIATDIKFIVANKKFIFKAQHNTLPQGRFPYVIGKPLASVTTKYGRGYITKLASLILTYIEVIDLLMTQFRLNVWGMWSYDPSKVPPKSALNFKAVVRHGKWYEYTGGDSIKNIYQNNNGLQLGLQIQTLFDFLLQIMSYQNEFVQGRPSTHSRTTAFEIRHKGDQAQGFFNDIAIELEDDIIKPLIELILITAFSHWNRTSMVDKDVMVPDEAHLSALEGMTFNQRLKVVINGQVKARGMSGRIRRNALFDKLALLFEIGAQYPALLQQVPPDKIARTFFESVGENANDWIIPQEPTPQTEVDQLEGGAVTGGGEETGLTPEQLDEIINSEGVPQ